MSGQEQLKSNILDKELCSSCGMCVGLCPYLKTALDRVRAIHSCGVEDGTCYRVCPKTGMDIKEMDLAVFQMERIDQALGVYKNIFIARAKGEKNKRVQYGGVTTALAALALEEKVISGAILTGGEVEDPLPVLALNTEEIKQCAGSKYTGVPTLAELNQAIINGRSQLGLVGRPCQVAAVRRAQLDKTMASRFKEPDTVKLVLGIFCFWALGSEFYGFIKRAIKHRKIIRMDVPVEGPMIVTEDKEFNFTLEDIRSFIKKPCQVCFDSTAEWADISVGATEFNPDWNTLIIRTEKGRELVDIAAAKGVLEICPYPDEKLPLLRKAVLNKKMRVLALPEVEAGQPGYPVVPAEYREEIGTQWGGVNR